MEGREDLSSVGAQKVSAMWEEFKTTIARRQRGGQT